MQRVARVIIKILEKFSQQTFLRIPTTRAAKLRTAVKSDLGFWYAGNIFDVTDIAHGIAYHGLIEPFGTRLVGVLLEQMRQQHKSLVFYDIGANTGYFGIMAAYLGQGKIVTHAFEPVAEHVEVESETVRLNNLESVCRLHQVALGNQQREVELQVIGSGTSLNKAFVAGQKVESRRVEEVPLSDFVKQHVIPQPDFVKIDVEGFEFEVVEGALSLLETALPVIWYESALTIHARKFSNEKFYETQSLLAKLGYEIYQGEEHLTEVKTSEPVADGVAMYLALHPKRHEYLLKALRQQNFMSEAI